MLSEAWFMAAPRVWASPATSISRSWRFTTSTEPNPVGLVALVAALAFAPSCLADQFAVDTTKDGIDSNGALAATEAPYTIQLICAAL